MNLREMGSRTWTYVWFTLGAISLIGSVAIEAGGRTSATEPLILGLTVLAIVCSLLAVAVSLRANRRSRPPDD
jgi:hypothetical protein